MERVQKAGAVVGWRGAPMQWPCVLVPDPSGRHGAAYGNVEVGLYVEDLDSLIDETSPLLIDVVMTGPATARFNSVWYGIKHDPEDLENGATGHIVYIGVNQGEIRMLAPGKSEGRHNISHYWASSDADNDGFPDPGAIPINPVPAVIETDDTHLGQ